MHDAKRYLWLFKRDVEFLCRMNSKNKREFILKYAGEEIVSCYKSSIDDFIDHEISKKLPKWRCELSKAANRYKQLVEVIPPLDGESVGEYDKRIDETCEILEPLVGLPRDTP